MTRAISANRPVRMLVVLVALALLAAGCGGAAAPEVLERVGAAYPAEVTQTGYAKIGGWSLVTAVATVENSSTERIHVVVDFTAYSASGDPLGRASDQLVIEPEQSAAAVAGPRVGDDADIGGVTADVEVSELAELDTSEAARPLPVASEVSYQPPEEGSVLSTVAGTIANESDLDLRAYKIVAVCYVDDAIVGGGGTISDGLHRAGSEREQEVVVEVTGDPDYCDLVTSYLASTTAT